MASDAQPSAFEVALVGWRDALRAINQMRSVAVPAFLLTVAAQAAYYYLTRGPKFANDPVAFSVLWTAQILALTPLALAVHRYVLLGELTHHYALSFADQRFRRFFGALIAIQALFLIPFIWFLAGHFVFGGPMFWGWGERITPGVQGREWVLVVGIVAFIVTTSVLFYVTFSIAILFPAIAVDAPGAGWRNAIYDSNQDFGRIVFTLWLALVPLFPLLILADPEKSGLWLGPIVVGVSAANSFLMVSALASVTSRLYMALGIRLRVGSGTPTPPQL